MKSFNSIDLTDIELDEEDIKLIDDLRLKMIHRKKGKLENVKIVLGFDEMSKAFIQVFDYYFTPLARTPYSLAIALPKLHGYYSIRPHNEIERTSLLKINFIHEYFNDDLWEIHPNW